jgi:hypothetical protein
VPIEALEQELGEDWVEEPLPLGLWDTAPEEADDYARFLKVSSSAGAKR